MECRACQAGGMLTARSKENKGVYTFVCSCEAGEKSHWASQKKLKHDLSPWGIPRWSQVYKKSDYEILY